MMLHAIIGCANKMIKESLSLQTIKKREEEKFVSINCFERLTKKSIGGKLSNSGVETFGEITAIREAITDDGARFSWIASV